MPSCSSPISFVEKEGETGYEEAMRAVERYCAEKKLTPERLAVVDYTQPSCFRRLAIYNIGSGEKKTYLVAHAAKTGDIKAEHFSNVPGSQKSSLGLFKVGEEYSGKNGRSLRLHGLEKAVNDNAYQRGIVLHSADYASPRAILINLICGYGPRIGRSNGCFVVSPDHIDEIVEALSEKGFLYAYYEGEYKHAH